MRRHLVLYIGLLLLAELAPPAPLRPPDAAQTWAWLGPKYSPRGGCTDQLVKAIGQARREVKVLAYSFTSEPIGDALIAAHKRGVKVEVVVDHGAAQSKNCLIPELRKAKIPCWTDHKHAIAHNKVMILDGVVVMTGSFNFTDDAENHNAENSVPIHEPAFVKAYLDNFELHRGHSEVVP